MTDCAAEYILINTYYHCHTADLLTRVGVSPCPGPLAVEPDFGKSCLNNDAEGGDSMEHNLITPFVIAL